MSSTPGLHDTGNGSKGKQHDLFWVISYKVAVLRALGWEDLGVRRRAARLCDGMLFSVDLVLPRYVPLGGSAILRCEYSVQREALHKVEWLRGHNKLLQFVKNRKPPFRHYTIVGAVIDKNHSNEREIMLRDLDLSASGYYTCEVSTEHPIFTKTSNEEELTVIIPQRTPPEVTIRKPVYTVGELLEANCSSSPAHPVPHITWLLNGDPVSTTMILASAVARCDRI
ncbi:uncharacterized protein [Anabrus simplex]|uniref:uncharacterized protein n=1 Tax=Anabrus simplex TaxID=316456 RepID=UPI0035A366E1